MTEICRRLDGIALAIELAAARMVSMSAQEMRDRLDDRFRLLSGARRGVERHQTLRQAVGWSYDLLNDDERGLLIRCAVFADGFDLAAITAMYCDDRLDEYTVLDLLDSLVRKSLLTIGQADGRTRYGMLETIRQFAEEQLAATGTLDHIRDIHAVYFAEQAVAYWEIWDGPDQRVALGWVDDEFANLRTGFRWAADKAELDVAAAVAAHCALLGFTLQRFEPAGWAEEILQAAADAEVRLLPRLYTAASLCMFTGRQEAGLLYAQTAETLEANDSFESFEEGWSSYWAGTAYGFSGRYDRRLEIYSDMAAKMGSAQLFGLCGLLYSLPSEGRSDEAIAIAGDTIRLARGRGNPFWIAHALVGYGRAFAEADPSRALDALREALDYTRDHRLQYWEALIAREAATLEAAHGDRDDALALFDTTIDLLHRAGNAATLAATLANLAVFFDRIEQPETAAIIYGANARHASINMVISLPTVLNHLRTVLGQTDYDECVAAGAAMEHIDAVHYARDQIQLARQRLEQREREDAR